MLEPFKETPFIANVERIKLDAGMGLALKITRTNGESDIVLYDAGHSTRQIDSLKLRTDAVAVVATFDASGNLIRAFFHDGENLRIGTTRLHTRPLGGFIASVDPPRCEIRIRPMSLGKIDTAAMVGRIIYFKHGDRRSPHTVASARMDGDELLIKITDDLLIGLAAKVDQASRGRFRSRPPPRCSLALSYLGAQASTPGGFLQYRRESNPSKMDDLPSKRPENRAAAGDEIWVSDVAPGDLFEFEPPPVTADSE